jgi:zinc transport system substrate-binding protein
MRTIIVLILVVVVGVAACGGSETGESRTEVAAAFYPLAFAAEEIAGAGVEVTNLTPPGVEPHDIELSVRDVERIRSADYVLYLGESFQPAVAEAAAEANGETLDLLAGMELREAGDAHGHEGEGDEHGGEDEGGTLDPHVWLDPTLYAGMARRLGTLIDRPGPAEEFARRLEELDREFERGLETCERREIVTSHAAFGYLAERYGLEQIAVTGLSPEAEPSADDLERLVDDVREHGATTVFSETLVSPRLAETIAREAGVETAVLNPLEGLTEEEAEAGADYFTVMRDNLATLREALGCT